MRMSVSDPKRTFSQSAIQREYHGQFKGDLVQKQEFDETFDEVITDVLVRRGFAQRGKSLFLSEGDRQLAWIRGAGRFAVPGSIAHLVCFRHSFLRDKNELVPKAAPGDAGNYPWVLSAELLPTTSASDWRFNPSRLMGLPYGWYAYSDLSQSVVRSDLSNRRDGFLRYIDWAAGLLHGDAEAQMRPFAGEYWVAGLWLDDYEKAKSTGEILDRHGCFRPKPDDDAPIAERQGDLN